MSSCSATRSSTMPRTPTVLRMSSRIFGACCRRDGRPLCAPSTAPRRPLGPQIARVPADASHLVISIGGNDALQNSDLLSLRVTSSGQALEAFASRLAAFEAAYRRAIAAALSLALPTAVCTIYNGALEPARATAARVGLALFNDVILRTAVDLGVDAIELRSICTEPSDYANPIEPSDAGGLKIARAVAQVVGALGCDRRAARVRGRC